MTPSDQELVEAFTTNQRARCLADKTIERRLLSLSLFARYMHPAPITAARPSDVEDWLNCQRSASTRHAFRSDLGCFYRWAVRRDLTDNDPVAKTDPVKVPRYLPKPAPVEAIARAFTHAAPDLQLAIMLGALAGLRRAEIASLHANDCFLDADPPVVHVRQGKGNRDRIVPLHPLLVDMLRGQRGWQFRSPGSTSHVRPATIGQRLAEALSIDGQRITGHQLRHYFGTEAARWSEGNVVLVSQLMGHASTNTTMGYIGWSPTAGAEVVSKITTIESTDELARRRRAKVV